MKYTIDQYEVGDIVDVHPMDEDDFHEFTGTIVKIDLEEEMLVVKDQDDDSWSVTAQQVKLSYSEEKESIY